MRRHYIYAIVLATILVTVFVSMFRITNDCSVKGGQVMRNAWGGFNCVSNSAILK